MVERLTRPSGVYEETDSSVRLRYKGAEQGNDIEAYFTQDVGARFAAQNYIMPLLKEPRRIITARTKLQGLNIDLNTQGTITHPRFNLASGKAARVVTTTISGSRSEVELGLLI